jgi:hypothetical protein
MSRTTVATAFIVLTVCLVAGCTDYEADGFLAERNFTKLSGQPISLAIEIFGPPTRTTSGPKGKMYEWSNATKFITAEEAKNNQEPTAPHCVIHIHVHYDEIILKTVVRGDIKTCHDFNEKLNEHFPYQPNGHWVNRLYLKDPSD